MLDHKSLRAHAPAHGRRRRRHHERLPRPPGRHRKKGQTKTFLAAACLLSSPAFPQTDLLLNAAYNAAKLEIEICSARASGRKPTVPSALRTSSGSANSRKLFTSVFLFFEKHNLTNSRKSSSLSTFSCADLSSPGNKPRRRNSSHSPGNRSVTKVDPTSGGGVKAARGISNTSSGREFNCVATERYP